MTVFQTHPRYRLLFGPGDAGPTPPPPVEGITATGGTVTDDGGFRYHTFTSDGTFTITETDGRTLEWVEVGGAGSGGSAAATEGPAQTLNFGPGAHTVGVADTATLLHLPAGQGGTGQGATTPTLAATTGDLDLRACIRMNDWTPTSDFSLAAIIGNWGPAATGDFGLFVTSAGAVNVTWLDSGGTSLAHASTVPTGFADGTTHWIRATLDVDNGAAGRTATFYTSNQSADTDPASIVWTQLGSPVTVAGTTTVRNATNVGFVGSIDNIEEWQGAFFYGEIRDGIDGSVIASPDFRDATPGAGSVVDVQANTWTVRTNSRILAAVLPGTVDFDLRGGKGADRNQPGGSGARVQGTLAVANGDTIDLFVGASAPGQTGGGQSGGGADGGDGGNNGGGGATGGGGGAATDIRLNGTADTDRVAVAGGGGGASDDRAGGGGGHPEGVDGLGSGTNGGGTQTEDGAGGSTINGRNGQNGDLVDPFGGAGGGGGWFGGGGGARGSTSTSGSGGGGSSWTDPILVTAVTHTNGENAGAGSASLTFAAPGGGEAGGGGGSGGVVTGSAPSTVGSWAVTIGAGGASVSGSFGNDGQPTTFALEPTPAQGGGSGGTNLADGGPGASGGGGGGSGPDANPPVASSGGAATQGAPGGPGAADVDLPGAGGGGGGVFDLGEAGSLTTGGGDGGPGVVWLDGQTYGAGGGGSLGVGGAGTPGQGGSGIGGNGGDGAGPATAGAANTGSGGGGSSEGTPSGAGGSGIVKVRYPL